MKISENEIKPIHREINDHIFENRNRKNDEVIATSGVNRKIPDKLDLSSIDITNNGMNPKL